MHAVMVPPHMPTPQPPEGFAAADTLNANANTSVSNLHNSDHKPILQESASTSSLSTYDLPLISNLPPITTVTLKTEPSLRTQCVETAAVVSAHASLADPLSTIFQIEKSDNELTFTQKPDPSRLLSILSESNIVRLNDKLEHHSILVEAANFAATACWTPPLPLHTPPSPDTFTTIAESGRTIFLDFLSQIERAREKYLYPDTIDKGSGFWHLSLMARDPRREYVTGAVRAVVEPFSRLADRDGVIMWLEAGNPRARDVYGYFGFVAVEVVTVHGVDTWCMIRRPR